MSSDATHLNTLKGQTRWCQSMESRDAQSVGISSLSSLASLDAEADEQGLSTDEPMQMLYLPNILPQRPPNTRSRWLTATRGVSAATAISFRHNPARSHRLERLKSSFSFDSSQSRRAPWEKDAAVLEEANVVRALDEHLAAVRKRSFTPGSQVRRELDQVVSRIQKAGEPMPKTFNDPEELVRIPSLLGGAVIGCMGAITRREDRELSRRAIFRVARPELSELESRVTGQWELNAYAIEHGLKEKERKEGVNAEYYEHRLRGLLTGGFTRDFRQLTINFSVFPVINIARCMHAVALLTFKSVWVPN